MIAMPIFKKNQRYACRTFIALSLVITTITSVTAFFPAHLHAQTAGDGALQGTVTDASGAVIGNAKVEARNQATGNVTTRTTTSDGLYTISPIIPGKYNVTVTAQGFSSLTQQNIQVDALRTVGLNLGSVAFNRTSVDPG